MIPELVMGRMPRKRGSESDQLKVLKRESFLSFFIFKKVLTYIVVNVLIYIESKK